MLRTLLLTTALLLAATGSLAQSTWQGRADVLSAGAAASIIAYQVCEGGSRSAGEKAHARLEQLAQSLAAGAGADLHEVQVYLVDATNLKVRALWQANQAHSCAQMGRLRQMAVSTGFDAPPASP